MLVWEIQAQYAAARESGDTDTIEILQAEAREIAKAEAHAVAISGNAQKLGLHNLTSG
jgi:hypothetical protein